MSLTILTPEEALDAMHSARERARQRISLSAEGINLDVRIALLDSHGGYGYLRHKLAAFEHIDRELLIQLNFAGIEHIWELCTRKRSELAALEDAAMEAPLLNGDQLDWIAQFLAQFDLDFVPE